MEDHNIAPINPLPGVVWLLVLPMIAVEIALSLGDAGVVGGAAAKGWRVAAMEAYGFFPDYWRQHLQNGAFDFELLRRFFTFSFVHGAAIDALFGVVLTLAIGKFVGEVFRAWAVATVFCGSAAVGALCFGALVQGQPLFGAFPGLYGLIGALSFLLLYGLGETPKRAFALIGGLLAIQLIYGVVFALLPMLFPSMGEMGGSWSWVADLTGFATGFALSYLVSPGGFGRIRSRLLQR